MERSSEAHPDPEESMESKPRGKKKGNNKSRGRAKTTAHASVKKANGKDQKSQDTKNPKTEVKKKPRRDRSATPQGRSEGEDEEEKKEPQVRLPTLAGEEISAEQKEMQREQKLPYFIQKQYVRDKNLRRPGEPEYDPSTLDIPKEDFD